MALIYPKFDLIYSSNQTPTAGEICLLNFLYKNLDDSYEIYYQPLINGDNPDIILMRKNSGILIIEVKDWNLNSYTLDEQGNFIVNKECCIVKSPFKQVNEYKNKIYSLHSVELLNKLIEDKRAYGIVKCAVYFHNETEKHLRSFLGEKANKIYKNNGILTRDKLNRENLYSLLNRFYLTKRSYLFTEKIYKDIKRYLLPPMHKYEDGKHINYTARQKQLIKSNVSNQKIKGVAGSGKTLILARRAVEAYKRTKGKVLILTFNITLRNYIHDRLSEVREDFSWGNFVIDNYHNFIRTVLNNVGVPINIPRISNKKELNKYLEEKYFSNIGLFKESKDSIGRYSAIFIDEVQDYKKVWLDIIKEYFLNDNGEYVLFGDEKQNIYERDLEEDKKPKTNIPGRWKSLNESFRLKTNIATLAMEFQKNYFKGKYYIDDMKKVSIQTTLGDICHNIEYMYLENEDKENLEKMVNQCYSIFQEYSIHPNDICFTCGKIELLREVDYIIRNTKKEETETIFESKEEYEKLESEKRKNLLDKIRRSRKYNFWMNRGTVKLCTIHSFKGWEVKTLVLIIDSDTNLRDELIYTGITRAMDYLLIVNMGNEKYHNFFTSKV
ncbi:ATP-dependent RecD-like DNA helicase [Clostridium acetireducens DSM 10703]|uniref:ATP-dependent RecD-like DNA helicase n=1 Tax=Clostridium acetireducens DSM 10703 TaxID=1121290 RepID=A0A1E8F1K5_9CLOT|nr:NERD domain-containing protein [Clostridium acetireducens]OFI07066.1 ATP-dependent RecD-like DNA helicase [Clostridium acetireducens DSM 10703]